MHTVDLLEQALHAVQRLGYHLRQDWLDGGGGGCEIKGEKWLFLDLGSSPSEQLRVVAEVLAREVSQRDASPRPVELDPGLRSFLTGRQAA
jgi:hypothetical protein